MTRPFDIEAARRGDQVQTVSGVIVHFIGQMSDGRIVYERAGELRHAPGCDLRMAPVPVTIYVVTWWFEGKLQDDHCFWFPNKDRADGYAASVKGKHGEPGNKWNHPVITPMEVSE